MPLFFPEAQKWVQDHLPEQFRGEALTALDLALMEESFMPISFIECKDGIIMFPQPGGFRGPEDKNIYLQALKYACRKESAKSVLFMSEAWAVLRVVLPGEKPGHHGPMPSESPDKLDVLSMNWESYDSSGKIIRSAAFFILLSDEGKKVDVKFMDAYEEKNGGKERVEGAATCFLMPREPAMKPRKP